MSKIIPVICLICFFCLYDLCYGSFGKSGWTIFRKISSTKFKTLTTITAARGDISGVFYNPAILGRNNQREVFLLSELGFAGDKFGGIIYTEPLKKGMLTGSIVYYDAGEMELYWFEGGELKTENVTAQRDILLLLSYGHRFTKRIFGGVTLKLARSEIAERKSAIAYSGDLGILYLPLQNLSVLVAVQNIGSSTKFIEKNSPLPTSGYVATGYLFRLTPSVSLLSGVGATYNFIDTKLIPEIGIELGKTGIKQGYEFISLNFGYRFNIQDANLHFGLGINWDNIHLGYAYTPGWYLGAIHRITVGYRFGTPPRRHRKPKRR